MTIHHGPGRAYWAPTRTALSAADWQFLGTTVCGTCHGNGYLLGPLRMCPFGCRPNLAHLIAVAQFPELLADAEAEWVANELAGAVTLPPPTVTAVARALGQNPDTLWDHVEGIHGWESHDDGYEAAVWAAAACTDSRHLAQVTP